MRRIGHRDGMAKKPEPKPDPDFPVADHFIVGPCGDPDDQGTHVHVTLLDAFDEPIAGFVMYPQQFDYLIECCREILGKDVAKQSN